MFATALRCCVSPIAQQKIVRSELMNDLRGLAYLLAPDAAAFRDLVPTNAPSDAANSANPAVCAR
jgi:hypothetical protein